MIRTEPRGRWRIQIRARAGRAAYDRRLRELAHDLVVDYQGVVSAGRVLALTFQADRLLQAPDDPAELRLAEVERIVHRHLLGDVATRAAMAGPVRRRVEP